MEPPTATKPSGASEADKKSIYQQGSIYLDVRVVWKKIQSLKTHPGKGILTRKTGYLPGQYDVQVCSFEFITAVFQCLSDIHTYVKHFSSHDDPVARAVWYRALDQLLGIERRLPHGELERHGIPADQIPCCPHAEEFAKRFATEIDSINNATKAADISGERTVSKRGEAEQQDIRSAPPGFKSGLNPWQQYLYNGSPGFIVDKRDQVVFDKMGTKQKIREQNLPSGLTQIIQGNLDEHEELLAEVGEQDEQKAAANMDRFETEHPDLGGGYQYTNLHGERTTAYYMAPHPRSELAPKLPQEAEDDEDDEDEDSKVGKLERTDRFLASLEGKGLPVHPRSDRQHMHRGQEFFHMMTVATSGEEAVEPKHDFGKMFKDWAI